MSGGPLADPPHLIAHRGGSALAPENTVAAFRQAVERWNVDLIELDVRASADGHCVVIHDATVDRTTNGTGDVAALTLAALRELDAGHTFSADGGASHPFRGQGVRIPTFDEVLEAVPETPLIVEVKAADAQRPLLDAIRRYGAEQRVIPSGERAADRTLFHDYPGVSGASSEQMRAYYIKHRLRLGRFFRPGFDTCQVPEVWEGRRVVTPALVRDLHRHGVVIHVWTVDDAADMHRLLDWGVDGLVTDRPDVLERVLVERGQR